MNKETIEIIFIEDNQYDAELAIKALNKNNITKNIIILEDGEKALNYFFCKEEFKNRNIYQNPKLILLDLKLPKIDGLEVLRVIKSDEKTKIIPVVVLTSSKEGKDIIESYKLGVNSYIVKPVDFNKFVETIRQMGVYWLLLNEVPQISV